MTTALDPTIPPPHALIIGGGIGGCALALFLKQAGISATVFEAYPRAQARQGGIGGGLQITPNGMLVLDHIGLADTVKRVGMIQSGMAFRNQYGRRVAQMSIDPNGEYDHPAVFVSRAELHRVLIEKVESEGIAIEFDKRLDQLIGVSEGHDQKRVTARFVDGSVAHGDLVVGADGAFSRTRALILGKDDPKTEFLGLLTTGGFVRTDAFLSLPDSEQHELHMLIGPGQQKLGYCRPSADDPRLVLWWRNMNVSDDPRWRGRVPTKDELKALDSEELKQRVLDIPGGWSPLARHLVTETKSVIRGTIQTVASLPRWFEGRAVLIGDAAHAVSPHSGQGASLALEDAMYLAKMLRLVMRDDPRLPTPLLTAAFRAFQDGRKARAEEIVEEGKSRGEKKKRGTTTRTNNDANNNIKEAVKEEKPPGPIKQWILELVLGIIFRLVVPRSVKPTYSYRIEWDNCETLADAVRNHQRLLNEQRQARWRRGAFAVGSAFTTGLVLLYVLCM